MEINRRATVFANSIRAGDLIEYRDQSLSGKEEYIFIYDRNYLISGDPIGHHFPLKSEPFSFDILPPFFTNLLSEGWLRKHHAEKSRLDKNDEFGLLCANGNELIGAISVVAGKVATLTGRQPVAVPIPASKTLEQQGVTIIGSPDDFNEYAIDHANGQSISGVQRKLLMKLEGKQLIPTGSGGQYIVKPAPEVAPHLPENEFFIMQLAKKVGFDVADCGLIPFESGELAYITKRFDIIDEQQRYFIEDGASLCQVHPKNKDSDALSYENVLLKLSRCAGNSKAVTLKLFLQVVFSHIVGNNDLHLKNFSMQRKLHKSNRIMDLVAPMYDMLSLAPYSTFDRACFMSFGVLAIEEGDEGDFSDAYNIFGFYTKEDFVQLGVNIGLPKLMVEKQIQVLKSKVLKVIEDGFRTQMPEHIYEAIVKRIRERCRTLELSYP
ncbi:HipA domain-containing protein [Pseudoalteromonas sp. SWXJ133]|uniref:type II toxin-antitoxin system HipA family toxin n=1 Tax=unclassified Pseudoalteromonas TaxID=194690 RepID=UPI00140C26D1|nr:MULTISPECIES: HipA domain-containing protein [unclassified Pseudoalteromonas]MBH0019743.1 HipA domain-containing protein [Pseudoalteromonas sp. SWXJ133]